MPERPLITIVNDDVVFCELMTELLNEEGYRTSVYHTTKEAYQRIREELPKLVVLDLVMGASENGLQVLNLLRLDPKTSHIPVIIATAALPVFKEVVPTLIAQGFPILEKPFDLDHLLQAVQRLIGPPPG